MTNTVHASEQGLALVEQARRQRRWNKTAQNWCQAAYTSRSTLNRFWARQAIRTDAFIAICAAVGVDWEAVVDHDAMVTEAEPLPWLSTNRQSERPASLVMSGHQDWGDAPAVDSFQGRRQELQQLTDWIVIDRCHLVLLLGMGGMGKTALVAKLAHDLTSEFDWIIWRSLRNAPPLSQLLSELIQFLSAQQATTLPTHLDGQLLELLQYLRQSRCLIVLDNAESILASGDRAGRYLTGYKGYSQLFQCIGNTDHASCLLLTAREQPQGLSSDIGATLPVRCLHLKGLPTQVVQTLFNKKGEFSATVADWQTLIHRYAGNPLALSIASSAIRDYFDCNISQFLALVQQGPFIFDDIRDLLAQQFQRLDTYERTIMGWLAIHRQPVSFIGLQQALVANVSLNTLMQVLVSLQRRSLIEKTPAGFTQQPVIMEYMTHLLIEETVDEFVQKQPRLLQSHALVQAQAAHYVRAAQEQLILQPITEQLLVHLGAAANIAHHCQQILTPLHGKSCQEIGYTAGNVVNLLRHLQVNFSGYDLSRLTIRQANFQGLNLQDVNLTGSDVHQSVFSQICGNVLVVAFSPDGRLLATGNNDNSIRLWDLETGQLQGICQGHTSWVRTLAFVPCALEADADTYQLASGSGDQTVKLWQVNTGECLQTFRGHTHEVFTVAFNCGGTVIASGSGDHTIKLWQVSTGELLTTCTGHTGWVRSVTFIPSDDEGATDLRLVSGSDDHTIKIWQGRTGQCLQTWTGHQGEVRAVAINADGTLLASGGNDHSLRLWDCQTGTCLCTDQSHQGGVYTVAFSPGYPVLASGSGDHTVRLWNTQTQDCIRTLQGHTNQIFSVAFDKTGQRLASVALDQTMRLWDWQTYRCLKRWQGASDWALPVVFHPDGHLLASTNSDRTINLWDWQAQDCLTTLQGHVAPIRSLAFSHDGNLLASGGTDQTVRLWNTNTGRLQRTFADHLDWVFTVALSEQVEPGKLLASGGADAQVRLWNLETGQLHNQLSGHTEQIWSVAFSPDGHWLASASTDQTIRIWDLNQGNCARILTGHSDRVYAVAFSPDGNCLASVGQDHTVKLWDIPTGNCRQTLKEHHSWVMAVAFSPTGLLATGSHDQTIKLWKITTGDCLRTLTGHTHLVCSLGFHPHGPILASGSQDQTVRVWNIDTGECLAVLTARLYENLDITDTKGLSDVQRCSLQTLGAIDRNRG